MVPFHRGHEHGGHLGTTPVVVVVIVFVVFVVFIVVAARTPPLCRRVKVNSFTFVILRYRRLEF